MPTVITPRGLSRIVEIDCAIPRRDRRDLNIMVTLVGQLFGHKFDEEREDITPGRLVILDQEHEWNYEGYIGKPFAVLASDGVFCFLLSLDEEDINVPGPRFVYPCSSVHLCEIQPYDELEGGM
jgi:hypothetical protein